MVVLIKKRNLFYYLNECTMVCSNSERSLVHHFVFFSCVERREKYFCALVNSESQYKKGVKTMVYRCSQCTGPVSLLYGFSHNKNTTANNKGRNRYDFTRGEGEEGSENQRKKNKWGDEGETNIMVLSILLSPPTRCWSASTLAWNYKDHTVPDIKIYICPLYKIFWGA